MTILKLGQSKVKVVTPLAKFDPVLVMWLVMCTLAIDCYSGGHRFDAHRGTFFSSIVKTNLHCKYSKS